MSTLIDCADTLNCATLSGSDNVNVAFQAGVPNKIVVSLSQSVVGLSKLEVTGNAIISNNSSNAALRITQTGAGEAIRVEDSANPDSTPFVVSSVGNVGIGTSSPSEKLEVSNPTDYCAIRVSANPTVNTANEAQVHLNSGLNGYTRLFYRESDKAFGIYHSGTAGPATKFRINDSGMSLMEGGGNVGVGVQSPAQKLDIRGGTEVNAQVYADSAGATRADLRLRVNNTTGDNYITFGDSTAFDVGRIQYNHNSDYMAFYVNSSEDMRITSNGNVGIGTATPQSILHIEANGYTNQTIRSAGAFAGSYILAQRSKGTLESKTALGIDDYAGGLLFSGYDGTNFINLAGVYGIVNGTPGTNDMPGALAFSTTADGSSTITERMRIDNTGSVGIGTATPSTKLHVRGDVSVEDTNPTVSFKNTSGNQIGSLAHNGSGGRMDLINEEANLLRLGTNGGPLVYIASSNVGINIDTPTQTLDINGTLRIRNLVAGTNTAPGRAATGEITALSSDKRLKKDISILSDSLNKVKNLRGVTFKWDKTNEPDFIIDDSEKEKEQIGLIAQEVEAVYPQLVYLNGVKDYKGVRYPELTAVLIEAVKELSSLNDELKQKLDDVMTRISALENK
jgi:hypothetical protein